MGIDVNKKIYLLSTTELLAYQRVNDNKSVVGVTT